MTTIEPSELLLVRAGGDSDVAAQGIERHRRQPARRGLDLVLATLMLIVLLPLMLVAALLVKLDSPGPAFFRQRRLGRDMRPFTVIKFRTMVDDAPPAIHREYIADLANGHANGNGLKKLSGDPRVTRVGRVLRGLSLDELPQLLNVLAGSMSLIGPRPGLHYELEHYQPHHYARFEVRPGITGLWQVSGRNSLGFVEMLDLDVEYATHGNLSTDLRILVRTPIAAVRHAA